MGLYIDNRWIGSGEYIHSLFSDVFDEYSEMNLITQGRMSMLCSSGAGSGSTDSRTPRELDSCYQQSLLFHVGIHVCSHLVAEQVCRRWWVVVCGGVEEICSVYMYACTVPSVRHLKR